MFLLQTIYVFLFLAISAKSMNIKLPNKSNKNSDSSSSLSLEEQVYYMSELEYKLIDLDDYLLDYTYHNFTTDCLQKNIQIMTNSDDKFISYFEKQLESPIQQLIIFANQHTLKVNVLALLANSTLLSFIDDASQIAQTTFMTTTHLQNITILPILGQDSCNQLNKINSTAFFLECTKIDPNAPVKIVTLYTFTGDDFSNQYGIDLSQIKQSTHILSFDIISQLQNENQHLSSVESIPELLSAYYTCARETSLFQNLTSGRIHYFRYCKYHETSQTNSSPQLKIDPITSFFEFYDLTAVSDGGVVVGLFPGVGFSDYQLMAQGVLQYKESFYLMLDFNYGLLIFNRTETGIYENLSYFLQYFYNQKYLNLFIMKNQDAEFTIQDSIPDYLIVNSQSYLIAYVIEESETGIPETFDPLYTISIGHFIQQIEFIHKQNKDQFFASSDKKEITLPDLSDLTSFSSIRFTFDSFLYYININFANSDDSYYLLINRALTDFTTDIKLNPQAIEVDYISKNKYSRMFHYPIPGLFYTNIRSRVRLFESGDPSLLITTFSWKSAQVLKLYTQQFSENYSCDILLLFNPKIDTDASGQKKMNLNINLVPRNFMGVISQKGTEIPLQFSNPQPYFQIQDWFFGAGVQFGYNYTCSSPIAAMNIIYSSTINITDSIIPPKTTDPTTPSTDTKCPDKPLCQDKLLAAIQSGSKYFIFYQDCTCKFWYEQCSLSPQRSSSFSTDHNKQLTNECRKSISQLFKAQIKQVLFDGENIILSTLSPIAGQESTSGRISQAMQIFYLNITNTDQLFGSSDTSYTSNPLDQLRNAADKAKVKFIKSFQKTKKHPTNTQKTPQSFTINLNATSNESQSQAQLNLSAPQSIEFNEKSFSSVLDLQIFCVPNTNKYSVIVQSSTTNQKLMAIFRVSNGIQDLQFYQWIEDQLIQDSYDVSLLDEGIIISSINANSTAKTPGLITIYKVNFLLNTIVIDRTFTKADMLTQVVVFQQNSLVVNTNTDNDSGQTMTMEKQIEAMKTKNIAFIGEIDNFMNNFAVKVWRNDESQTYRFLLIDFDNNCLFDYYLYDLILPIFVRQVNLFDFQIVPNQLLQITNDMMCLYTTKDQSMYLISIQIDGDSIDQLKQIEIQQDTQSFTQVQQSLDTQYQGGSLCGVYSLPSSQIRCIFSPYIQLNFDFSQNRSNINSTTYFSSDKHVNFKFQVLTDLNPELHNITLLANFSNFDTDLQDINTISSTQYLAQNGTTLGDNNKSKQQSMQYLNLDTSFVSGSIEKYFIQATQSSSTDSSKNQLIDSNSVQKYNVTVQGYVNIDNYQSELLILKSEENVNVTNRNPYQLVCLTDSKIIVINQNLQYSFEQIFLIEYQNIKIQTKNLQDSKTPYVAQNCSNIFSNEVSTSQSTTTYLYLLQCWISTIDSSEQFLSFTVDINHFSSLEDQSFDWNKAMQHNVRLVDVKIAEEYFADIISSISYISILSLTDSLNNVGAYIFLFVRDVQITDSQQPGDNIIYILWGVNEVMTNSFTLTGIDQINSCDYDLNYLKVNNFQASFPQAYQNQMRINLLVRQPFVFNIGWDDGERYVFLSLLKIVLPPLDELSENQNQKEVFQIQYEDIQSSQFTDYIKADQTWKKQLTPLTSMITFFDDSYNASVLIANQFSIVEFSCNLSPSPYLDTLLSSDTTSFNTMQNIAIYTQYAWCENEFNVDGIKQQLLKYDTFFLIQCKSITREQILKVYKISDDDSNNSISNENGNTHESIKLMNNRLLENDNTNTQNKVQNKKYSMVQSISYGNDKSIVSMTFRTDNQELFLDLILNSIISYDDKLNNTYELHQYSVYSKPILLYPADIPDSAQIQVCVSNRYTTSLCNTAVFSNVIVDTSMLYMKQWFKFGGLVALPLFITVSIIFASFLAMKKLRKKRQEEFADLLRTQNAPQYKSKSNLSSFSPPFESDANTGKIEPYVGSPRRSIDSTGNFNVSTDLR